MKAGSLRGQKRRQRDRKRSLKAEAGGKIYDAKTPLESLVAQMCLDAHAKLAPWLVKCCRGTVRVLYPR